jgi:hypothetical protein
MPRPAKLPDLTGIDPTHLMLAVLTVRSDRSAAFYGPASIGCPKNALYGLIVEGTTRRKSGVRHH